MNTSVLNYLNEFQSYYQKLKEAEELKTCSFDYKVNRVFESYRKMFDRFCPFKEGDEVVLAKTPEIGKDSGWYGSRHFLIEGAKAIVVGRDWQGDQFTFYIEFVDETWIDSNGKEQPVVEKHLFYFGESWLKLP